MHRQCPHGRQPWPGRDVQTAVQEAGRTLTRTTRTMPPRIPSLKRRRRRRRHTRRHRCSRGPLRRASSAAALQRASAAAAPRRASPVAPPRASPAPRHASPAAAPPRASPGAPPLCLRAAPITSAATRCAPDLRAIATPIALPQDGPAGTRRTPPHGCSCLCASLHIPALDCTCQRTLICTDCQATTPSAAPRRSRTPLCQLPTAHTLHHARPYISCNARAVPPCMRVSASSRVLWGMHSCRQQAPRLGCL